MTCSAGGLGRWPGLTPPTPLTALHRAPDRLRPYPHDPDKAARLWRAAGGAARPLRLATMGAWEDVAHLVAKQLGTALNLPVEVSVLRGEQQREARRRLAGKQPRNWDVLLLEQGSQTADVLPLELHRAFAGRSGEFRAGPVDARFEPLFAYLVAAVLCQSGPDVSPRHRDTDGMRCPMLVGRDLELSIVHKAVETAHHGAGGTVLLLGEAGVGKSRLVAQVCEFAREAEGIAAAHAAAPGDPEVEAAEWGDIRWAYWLARAEDARGLDALDRAMSIYRVHPELPFPFRGVWVLLHTVLGDGAAARAEVRAGPQLTTRANWVLLHFADAVALGRSGHAAQAVEAFAEAVAAGPTPGVCVHQHVLRLVSSAALRDGWVNRLPGCGRHWTGSRHTTSRAPHRPAGGCCGRPVSRCRGEAGETRPYPTSRSDSPSSWRVHTPGATRSCSSSLGRR